MKEYVYTMPQSFMDDKSVPAHWRLLGYLNGFFINGNAVWASNETIGEKIGCSPRSIQTAVKTLEDKGLIVCERTRRTRIITPKITLNDDYTTENKSVKIETKRHIVTGKQIGRAHV